MCKNDSITSCCQNPELLTDHATECSKEQMAQCHGSTERHPCTCTIQEDSMAKRLYIAFVLIVVCAPFLFQIYWKNDLVCAPRAITASAIFGIIPLIFLTIGFLKKKAIFFYLSLFVLVVEIMITPIIMLKRLGWEKFAGERLLAFFTFEGIAIAQIVIVYLVFKALSRENRTASRAPHLS